MLKDLFKVKVIEIKDMQPGDQHLTIGKVYDAWDEAHGNVNIFDDIGNESALFEGEWEKA